MSYEKQPSCPAFVGQNYVAETPAVAITINNLEDIRCVREARLADWERSTAFRRRASGRTVLPVRRKG
jgi:hypothetical protein